MDKKTGNIELTVRSKEERKAEQELKSKGVSSEEQNFGGKGAKTSLHAALARVGLAKVAAEKVKVRKLAQ